MTTLPGEPGGFGARQQRAAELRAEQERAARMSPGSAQTDAAPAQSPGAPEPLAAQQTAVAQPVGSGDYVVKPGDCMAKIAKEKGHFWDTIWTDGGNAELKEARKDPNVLRPGDKVVIPEKEKKQEPGAAEQRHRFKRKGEPSALNLKFMANDKPLANKPFKLVIDNNAAQAIVGTTDPQGKITNVPIPGNAKKGLLTIQISAEEEVTHELLLGSVCPHDDLGGVQNRLRNLGFGCDVTGKLDAATKRALRKFQAAERLTVTGDPDEATMDRLKEKFGS